MLTLLSGARRGERLPASEIARALGKEIEGVRSAINRLWKKRAIARRSGIHEYAIGNAVARHVRYLWFVPASSNESRR